MFSLARSASVLHSLKRVSRLRVPQMQSLYQFQPAMSFLQMPKSYFSGENSQTDKDSHDDFKPKTKIDLDEGNVTQQIEEVLVRSYDYLKLFVVAS